MGGHWSTEEGRQVSTLREIAKAARGSIQNASPLAKATFWTWQIMTKGQNSWHLLVARHGGEKE